MFPSFNDHPMSDLVVGASLYFPPLFKVLFCSLLGWLVIHRLSRGWLYSGRFWHPLLVDLSLFILTFSATFWLFVIW
jgi:hypothetical protein